MGWGWCPDPIAIFSGSKRNWTRRAGGVVGLLGSFSWFPWTHFPLAWPWCLFLGLPLVPVLGLELLIMWWLQVRTSWCEVMSCMEHRFQRHQPGFLEPSFSFVKMVCCQGHGSGVGSITGIILGCWQVDTDRVSNAHTDRSVFSAQLSRRDLCM